MKKLWNYSKEYLRTIPFDLETYPQGVVKWVKQNKTDKSSSFVKCWQDLSYVYTSKCVYDYMVLYKSVEWKILSWKCVLRGLCWCKGK